ncbi:hypothetical protein SY83_19080 [Paenibacillus swuensis]|uniref:DUF2627 domain-containing protein n=1 Tax=Paenibacillus swuensis TaxID=1178515 RepID=A0A172TQE7_9BACL|nr:DUF2627 domain-containing protein [Paenibacillus swuensis]ANE49037.1 hypothetical protein SY83_19080 [Paenibacillus swuensis]
MKLKIARFIAILILVIPGVLATFGFLHMKDAVFLFFSQFGESGAEPSFRWGKFMLGFVEFAAGVGFIGGWIFFRDRKRNYVAPRFKVKKKRPQ